MKLKVIGLQFNIEWENKPANHAKVEKMINEIKPQSKTVIVLPEMFATGFSMNVSAINDSETQETQNFMSYLASKYSVYLIGGVVSKNHRERGSNEMVIYDYTGREINRYRKIRPYSVGGETKYYDPGDHIQIVEIEGFKLAPFICYDLRFPELFREAVKLGANVFCVIASWPEAREEQTEHWMTLLKARAIENQAYVIGVNRCGTDPNYYYPGRSRIIDPLGKVMVEAKNDEESISAEFELDTIITYREVFPALKDMK